MPEWVTFITGIAGELVRAASADRASLDAELGAIERFTLTRLIGVLDAEGNTADIVTASDYDVLRWAADDTGRPLSAFAAPIQYRFSFDEGQLRERADQFQRYGTDAPGLFRILARTPTLHRLFRRVELVAPAARVS
jgi:hypothetical protein